jgi:membrane fusion protein, heavy metal efflux system
MNGKAIINAGIAALLLIGGAFAAKQILGIKIGGGEHAHGHGEEAAAEDKSKVRGPHGGRLFGEKDFQCEMQIYEPEGITPQFHLYFFKDGQPLDRRMSTQRSRWSASTVPT